MLLLSSTIKGIAVVGYLVLILLLIRNRLANRQKRLFLLYLAGLLVWALCAVLINFSRRVQVAFWLYNLEGAAASLQSIIFFPFTWAFLDKKGRRLPVLLAYAACVLVFAISVSGFSFGELYLGKAGYYIPRLSTTTYVLSLIMYSFWLAGVLNLLLALLKEKIPLRRNRIKYPLVGALLVMAGIATNFTGLQDYPVDFACGLLNAILISYAVARYRLLQIRTAIKRGLIHILVLGTAVGSYLLLTLLLRRLAAGRMEDPAIWAGLLVLLVIVTGSYLLRDNLLFRFLRSLSSPIRPDRERSLEEFSRAVNTIMEAEAIGELIPRAAAGVAGTEAGLLFLPGGPRKRYTVSAGCGPASREAADLYLGADDVLVQLLRQDAAPVWRDEVAIDPRYRRTRNELLQTFERTGIDLAVPIIRKGELVGVIGLGSKTSRELFTEDDFTHLATMANLAASALGNAFTYSALQRRLSEQAMLFVLSETLVRSLGAADAMQSATQILVDFLGVEHCAIIATDPKGECSVLSSRNLQGIVLEAASAECRRLAGDPAALEPGNPHRLPAARSHLPDGPARRLHDSLVVLPLKKGRDIAGFLVLEDQGMEDRVEREGLLRAVGAILCQGVILHRSIAALAALERYSQSVIRSIGASGELFLVVDPAGVIIRLNQSALDLLGYEEGELRGVPIDRIVHRIDSPIRFSRGIVTEEPLSNTEAFFSGKRGELIPVLLSSSPIRDERGEIQEVLILARDISGLKDAERTLRISEEKYRSLFEGVQDVVFTCDVRGAFQDINPAGVTLFGFSSRGDFLASDLAGRLLPGSPSFGTMRDRLLAEGSVRDYELDLERSGGEKLVVLVTARASLDAAGRADAFQGIMRDVTEQRELQRQLIQAQKMESIGTLAGGIAHDFNNILAAILGYTSLMTMHVQKDPELSSYLEIVERSVKRAAGLTGQLLAFSHANMKREDMIDLNALVRDTVQLLRETFDRSIEIDELLGEGLPMIKGERTQIQQVIMNLCVNSRDAMPDGGRLILHTDRPSEDICGYDGASAPSQCIRLRVIDSGTGIDEKHLTKIFDPFFTTKEPGTGTGLGLWVVYGVVRNHNGRMNVKSVRGRGTTFEILFPAAPSVDRVEEAETPQGSRTGTETILVVDDEPAIRGFCRDVLQRFGYKVVEAADGQEAIEIYRQRGRQIDLVILDMIMPRLGGRDAFLEIKTINSSVRTILSSGRSDTQEAAELLSLGVMDTLHKPFEVGGLLRAVRSVLDTA